MARTGRALKLDVKPGVDDTDLSAGILHAESIMAELYQEYGVTGTMTAGRDEHVDPSKHASGNGIDGRSHVIPPDKRDMFAKELQRRLGPKYYAGFERAQPPSKKHPKGIAEHFHVQYGLKGMTMPDPRDQ